MAEEKVEKYIAGLDGWKAEVVSGVRKIVQEAAPEAKEAFKWAQPVYEINGPFAYIKAFKSSVNFGFWRGVDLDDPAGRLQGSGEKMRHVRLTGVDDIDPELFKGYIKQAVDLNLTKGDPTKG